MFHFFHDWSDWTNSTSKIVVKTKDNLEVSYYINIKVKRCETCHYHKIKELRDKGLNFSLIQYAY